MLAVAITSSAYWRMIFARVWTAAWARTRSWSALLTIFIGVTALYFALVERWRPQLTWIVPLTILVALVGWYLPKTIFDVYRELERRADAQEGGLAGKFFHTFHALHEAGAQIASFRVAAGVQPID